ncbi:MAG: SDR family oxidoreductase [Proteobacteria bacterium]|nr:SDR family oxidoreductase [Pseudomonadota bacterium]MBU1387966.1 SDR family oxidoreductase [Pseudomonadota bacterium]MBU1542029.1 SDR family oxidoreductase [Pseudomonadota bacterium]MBU2483064.1 SDR family oxidoreductase [Pseudomonadota bacterium]
MYGDLKNKVALVTGSGKKTGIGYAIAEKLAASGCHIVIADLGAKKNYDCDVVTGTLDEMEQIKQELEKAYGIEVLCVNLDVTDADSTKKMAAKIQDQFGRVDILCNNAGASFGVPNGVHTYDEAAWVKTVDVNLHGVFRVSQAIVPLMQEKGGSIINTASRAGKVPPLFNGAYAVSKAAVIMLTKVMAKELAGLKIKVNAVCPGQIMTDLEKWRFGLEAQFFNTTVEQRQMEMCATIPMGRIGTPKEVADLVAYLASDQSSYITGQALNVCGGQLMEL